MKETERREVLQKILEEYELPGKVAGASSGASVTCFDIALVPGVNVRKVAKLAPVIAKRFSVANVRVVAPIPGTPRVGIEIPNERRRKVDLREVLKAAAQKCGKMHLPVVVGTNVKNKPVVFDLATAPHVLVAGSDEDEKNMGLDAVIVNLLCRFPPEDLKFVMLDSSGKCLEKYGNLPHILPPLCAEPAEFPATLKWVSDEIDRRNKMFIRERVRTLYELLRRADEAEEEDAVTPVRLPYIIVVLGELAEAMTGREKRKIEMELCRIALCGRPAGIHLIVGTSQVRRNSLTCVIKATLPTRICFRVESDTESRLILDASGAELLTGGGDLLLATSDMKITRTQCATLPFRELDNATNPVCQLNTSTPRNLQKGR